MIELSKERVDQILNEETMNDVDAKAVLRSIYARYIHTYEKFFEDIDALNDETIAELRQYQEETISLARYYRMDIPKDICDHLDEFEDKYGSKLLGPDWQKYLSDSYKKYGGNNKNGTLSEEERKAEYTKKALSYFYDSMDYVFREGFDTGSATAKTIW